MVYKRSTTGVVERSYTYDEIGRPLTRRTARNAGTVNDSFGYNTRSELISATVSGNDYAYSYDNIGNRAMAQEAAETATAYTANNLNQYTAVGDFTPTYDAAGNQTSVKTATDIWTVEYNAKAGGPSFTKAWEGFFGSVMYGVNGRTSYADPSEVKPSEKDDNIYAKKPQWIPHKPSF